MPRYETVTSYSLVWDYADGSGFTFSCDAQGNVDSSRLADAGRRNLERLRAGTMRGRAGAPIVGPRIVTHSARVAYCDCGSGEHAYPLHDGRGIFLTYACDACQTRVLRRYRADILESYDTDEPIDADY